MSFLEKANVLSDDTQLALNKMPIGFSDKLITFTLSNENINSRSELLRLCELKTKEEYLTKSRQTSLYSSFL